MAEQGIIVAAEIQCKSRGVPKAGANKATHYASTPDPTSAISGLGLKKKLEEVTDAVFKAMVDNLRAESRKSNGNNQLRVFFAAKASCDMCKTSNILCTKAEIGVACEPCKFDEEKCFCSWEINWITSQLESKWDFDPSVFRKRLVDVIKPARGWRFRTKGSALHVAAVQHENPVIDDGPMPANKQENAGTPAALSTGLAQDVFDNLEDDRSINDANLGNLITRLQAGTNIYESIAREKPWTYRGAQSKEFLDQIGWWSQLALRRMQRNEWEGAVKYMELVRDVVLDEVFMWDKGELVQGRGDEANLNVGGSRKRKSPATDDSGVERSKREHLMGEDGF